MTSRDTNAASAINEIIIHKVPWPGDWHCVNSGTNQTIFADFNPTGSDGEPIKDEIYLNSAQLANLYAGYSINGGSTGAFSTTAGVLPESGVDIQAASRLTDVLSLAYGNIAYYLSAAEQKKHNEEGLDINSKMQSVAQKVRAAYTANKAYKTAVPSLFGTATKVDDPSNSLTLSLGAMSNLITIYGTDLIKSSSVYWNEWKKANQSTGFGANSKAEMMQVLTDKITLHLIQGTLSGGWSTNFNQGFGGINPITGDTKYSLPWSSSLFADYRSVVSSGEYTQYFNKTALMAAKNQSLTYALTYLTSLEAYNQNPNQPQSIPTDAYMKVVGENAYAPTYSITPKQDSVTHIDLMLSTEKGDSITAISSSGDSITCDTEEGGWWWSASTANLGSDASRTPWDQFDSQAKDVVGKFIWDNLQQIEITPNSNWYRRDEINAACVTGMTKDNPHFQEGYAFANPTAQGWFTTGELYRIAQIAHGDTKSIVTGSSTNASKYNQRDFSSFEQNTKPQGGIGWGPFSVGAASSIGITNDQQQQINRLTNSGEDWSVVNQPNAGIKSTTSTGAPSQMLGVTLESIGIANATGIDPANSGQKIWEPKTEIAERTSTYSNPDPNSTANNWYQLGNGDDTHFGDYRNEFIAGGDHDDILYGFGGNDFLKGGNGDDVIYGMDGYNKVWGGAGNDYYVFQKQWIADEENGFARIMDFNKDEDGISFSGYTSDQVSHNGKRLYLDGVYAAKFEGCSGDELAHMIHDAHYSLA